MRARRGFTIVEVLVALLILNVGLLGLVTTAGAVTRMFRRGQAATTAAALAAGRLETLREDGCTATAGSETQSGLTLEWRAAAAPFPNAVLLTLRIRGPDDREDSLVTALFCP